MNFRKICFDLGGYLGNYKIIVCYAASVHSKQGLVLSPTQHLKESRKNKNLKRVT
ncbi:MAG: hypothetical protein ABF422_02920 [Liquorilactobacillus satsumensis]|uniref:hypothetical protein n=1 Tax=Liquorilactobacillus satsumensis TaxID=259059 RepID=UPI0039EC4A10